MVCFFFFLFFKYILFFFFFIIKFYFFFFFFNLFKKGASFRNTGEILNLTGCDKLTISPKLLEELKEIKDKNIDCKLSKENAKLEDIQKI